MKKAREEERYVPWCYVFCDFSVTGLDATRQGYRSYKSILAGKAHSIDTTYIDDFTRASRDEVEWWQLAALSKRCSKRLIGASDGFSLHDPDWDMKLTMYGLLSRLFIKSLRQKVRRGMTGTAGRGGTLGRPPLGFSRRPKRDAQGNVLYDSDGNPKTEYCIDPATQPIVHEVFEKYVVKQWTSYQIARDFNTRNVNNWAGWTEAGIRKVLGNPAYVGVFIWNKTRGEYDLETRKRRAVRNPRRDWIIHYDPQLLAVPKEWWKAARRRLASRRANRTAITRRGGSAQRAAKTLFHDALICGYCHRPLRLYRSAGPHRDLHCINGPVGQHGCKLSCSKAVRIVEEGLLTYIKGALFTEAVIAELVRKANVYLAEMADKPREDMALQRARMRRAQASIDKLVGLIEAADDKTLIESYDRRVKELQKEVTELRREIQGAEQRNAPPPAPLDEARVQEYLADLRGVLSLETQAANALLRTLMGQIRIHQQPLAPGRKRGAPWVATFEPNVVALLARLGAMHNYPDSITLEYLSKRIWIKPKTATVELGYKHKYVQLAEDEAFMKLLRQGRNAHEISRILGHSYEMVVDAIRFAKTGERPVPRSPRLKKYSRRKMKREPRYIASAREVARLKDEEGHTFPVIARKLGMSSDTASRAYNRFHAQKLRDAADRGLPIPKARYSHVGYNKLREIQKLAIEGVKPSEIAARVGCSAQTVLRARKGAAK